MRDILYLVEITLHAMNFRSERTKSNCMQWIFTWAWKIVWRVQKLFTNMWQKLTNYAYVFRRVRLFWIWYHWLFTLATKSSLTFDNWPGMSRRNVQRLMDNATRGPPLNPPWTYYCAIWTSRNVGSSHPFTMSKALKNLSCLKLHQETVFIIIWVLGGEKKI